MDIIERRVFRGPNQYAHFKVIRLTLISVRLKIIQALRFLGSMTNYSNGFRV